MSLLLALDTSTRTASVALFDGEHVLSETTWLAGREHSSRLLVEVQAALERIGRTPRDLTGLVAAHGPGSFTGVRVALSVAKGMAAALAIPAWGVSSLDALACAADTSEGDVLAVLEAGRGRYAVGLYRDGVARGPARLATLEQIQGVIAAPTLVIGELTPADRLGLAEHPDVRLASAALGVRRAGYVAELGWRLAASGDPGDPRAVDAVYVS